MQEISWAFVFVIDTDLQEDAEETAVAA